MNKGGLALLITLLALSLSAPAYAVKGQIYKWKEERHGALFRYAAAW